MSALLLILLLVGQTQEVIGDLPSRPSSGRTEDRGVTISSIVVQGNHRIEAEKVKMLAGIGEGDTITQEGVTRIVRRLYRSKYFKHVSCYVQEAGGRGVLVIRVQELPRVREVYVYGNEHVSLDDINKILEIKLNEPYSVRDLNNSVNAIEKMYHTRGYPFATVRPELTYTETGDVIIHLYISENITVRVRAVTFSGNTFFTSDQLLSILQLTPQSAEDADSYFLESLVEEDRQRILAYYAMHGFFLEPGLKSPNEYVSYSVRFSSDLREAYIHYTIHEGTRWRLGSIRFRGQLVAPISKIKGMTDDEIREKARALLLRVVHRYMKEGGYLSSMALEKAKNAILMLYKSDGYSNATVSIERTVSGQDTLDLTFNIQAADLDSKPGKFRIVPKGTNSGAKAPAITTWPFNAGRTYIERIEIEGNDTTRDKVIRRELVIHEGDLYSLSKIKQSEARIKRLGYFSEVSIETERGSSSDAVRLKVKVKERQSGTFQIAAGFSTYENLVLQARITHQNLFGNGQTLSLQAQLSSLRQLFYLRFVEPYFLDSDWYFSFSLYKTMYYYGSFSKTTEGGSLSWGYNFTPFHRMYITYKLNNVQIGTGTTLLGSATGTSSFFRMPSSAYVANLFNDGLTSSVTLTAVWDRRDDRMFPSKGFMHGGSVEVAPSWLLSKNVYTRYEAYTRWYFPVWRKYGLVFKTNAEIGYITSPDPQGVPIFLRYFLGGINSVRGFALYSLAPTMKVPVSPDPNAPLFDFRKGGNKKLVLNWELEFDIFKMMMLKGVLFVDAGNAFDDGEPYSLEHLRWAWGFGIRWFSPMGPLRFEWGLPFNPRPGEDKVVFQFSMGNFF